MNEIVGEKETEYQRERQIIINELNDLRNHYFNTQQVKIELEVNYEQANQMLVSKQQDLELARQQVK